MNAAFLVRKRFITITAKVTLAFFTFSTCLTILPCSTVAAKTQPVIYTTGFSYDLNGNIDTRTTSSADTINYEYDSLNRITKILYPGGAEVSYTYDAGGNRLSMTDSHGTTYYAYDEFDQLRAVQFSGITPIYYEYDKVGNLTEITYPTGEEIAYGYDSDNRLISVTDASGTTSYDYSDQNNKVVKKTLPNGVHTQYEYDAARRVTDVWNKKADDTLISHYQYEYDDNSNPTKIQKTTLEGINTVDYSYDKLNRLLRAEYSNGTYEAYTYDDSGNRLTKTTQNGTILYSYDGDNRLLRAGDTLYLCSGTSKFSHRSQKTRYFQCQDFQRYAL